MIGPLNNGSKIADEIPGQKEFIFHVNFDIAGNPILYRFGVFWFFGEKCVL